MTTPSGDASANAHVSVDSLTVIRAICRHRCNVSIDLIKQVWNFGNIADIIRRQFDRDNFMRVGINTEM